MESDSGRAATAGPADLPLHNGSHPEYMDVANDLASKELAEFTEQFGSTDKIPPEELAEAVARVESELRDQVKSLSQDGHEKPRQCMDRGSHMRRAGKTAGPGA